MIFVIYVLGTINLVILLACLSEGSRSQAATFDGMGEAIMAMGSIGLSVVLTLLGAYCILSEMNKKRFVVRATLATIVAAVPFAIYLVMRTSSGR